MHKSIKKIKKKLKKIHKKNGLVKFSRHLMDDYYEPWPFEPWFPDTEEFEPMIPVAAECASAIYFSEPTDRGAKRIERISRQLLEQNDFVVRMEKLYYYDGLRGVYSDISGKKFAVFLEQQLSEADRSSLLSRTISEIHENVVRKCSGLDTEVQFNMDITKINCSNGVVQLTDTGIVLLPHSPDDMFNYMVNASFDENATVDELWEQCPTFRKYVNSTFRDDPYNKTRLLLEMLGYLLSDSMRGKCAIFLIGAANSGKSVVSEFLTELLGEAQVTNLSLHKLDKPFNLVKLHDAKLAISTETSAKPFKGLDNFKIVTSGDRIAAEYKGKDVFSFLVRCKILIVGNVFPIPDESDPSDGFFNRIRVLHFAISIDKAEQDPELLDKLWQERDAIFSLAVRAFAELHKRNYVFHEPMSSKRFLENYKTGADSVKLYIQERLAPDTKSKIARKTVYDDYAVFCKANGLEMRKDTELRQAIDLAFADIENKKVNVDGKSVQGWYGLRFVGGNNNETVK